MPKSNEKTLWCFHTYFFDKLRWEMTTSQLTLGLKPLLHSLEELEPTNAGFLEVWFNNIHYLDLPKILPLVGSLRGFVKGLFVFSMRQIYVAQQKLQSSREETVRTPPQVRPTKASRITPSTQEKRRGNLKNNLKGKETPKQQNKTPKFATKQKNS